MESVFCFTYTECCYEGAPATISIHRTEEGAKKAMNEHIEKTRREWARTFRSKHEREANPFGEFDCWNVDVLPILD